VEDTFSHGDLRSTPVLLGRISHKCGVEVVGVAAMVEPSYHGGRSIRGLHEPLRRSTEALQIASRRAGVMEETRKLYRSRTERMVAGVCGGLAEYFNVDTTVIRVLFLVLTLFGGSGLVVYVVMWILVPDASKAPPTTSAPPPPV
jgi:phage shock protein C